MNLDGGLSLHIERLRAGLLRLHDESVPGPLLNRPTVQSVRFCQDAGRVSHAPFDTDHNSFSDGHRQRPQGPPASTPHRHGRVEVSELRQTTGHAVRGGGEGLKEGRLWKQRYSDVSHWSF